jgi:hypothetical protein
MLGENANGKKSLTTNGESIPGGSESLPGGCDELAPGGRLSLPYPFIIPLCHNSIFHLSKKFFSSLLKLSSGFAKKSKNKYNCYCNE